MIRIKLFGLFIAFALLALVRPRKCLELLEAADAGNAAVSYEALRAAMHHNGTPDHAAARERIMARVQAGQERVDHVLKMGTRITEKRWRPIPDECPLPPAGCACGRRAGHKGYCAAVVK